MNKNLVSFLVFVVGLGVFHNAIFPIFTPKEIGWILNRYVYFLLFVAYLIITNLVLRLKPPVAMTALFVWGLGFYFYKFVLYPPIPWTLFITYMEEDPVMSAKYDRLAHDLMKVSLTAYSWTAILAIIQAMPTWMIRISQHDGCCFFVHR